MFTKSKKCFLLASAALPLTLLVPMASVAAQDAMPSVEDEIVVTGSRIRRTNLTTAVPVQGLNTEDLAISGSVDVGELLTEIPGVQYSLSPEGTGLSVQNPGLSTINLRGLGGDRTLVLINGRRAVSNSGNGERVSTDTIPSGFVRRIEVTTGGASAIYGADAIAGVANIILRENFEGLRAGYRYGKADASGEEENTVDLTLGKNFNNDRSNVMLGLTYDDESAVYQDASRPDTINPIEFIGGAEQFGPGLSSNIIGGRFESDDAWNIGGVWFNDKSLAPNDGRDPAIGFETDLDGYNLRPGRTLSPAVETLALAARATHDFDSSVTGFAEAYYTQVDSQTVNAARSATSGTDIGPAGNSIDIGSMASNHPFIPPEVEETRSGTVSWVRRFAELGLDIKDNERNTLRLAAGLEGETFGDWNWSTFVSYGEFEQTQIQRNALNYQNVRNALRIESDGAGGFQCTDADARDAGCVPLNIFGEDSITDEMANYIRYTGRLYQERAQTVLGANMNGSIYELPAGTLKGAFGVEYRKESQTTIGDPDVGGANAPQTTSVSVVPNIDASFDVFEAFGELDIPLIADKPGIYDLRAQVAGRVGNYSTIGTIFSYNIGGSYSPSQNIRFRAQYSRSQRAPNITEYFSDKRGDFDDLDDPCAGVNRDGSGATTAAAGANCISEAGIQAYFADPDNAGLAFDAGGDSVFGPNAGNDQLEEETADTFTIGAIFTPKSIPNFSLVVDYYNIEIDGAIGTISTQDTVDLCYNAASFPTNRFCDVITRDLTTGQINEVVNREENLNSLTAEGIDLTIKYSYEPKSLPGEFSFGFIYNHVLKDEQVFQGLNGPELSDFLGEIGSPKDAFRARFGWSNDALTLGYTWRYRSGGVDDNTVARSDADFYEVDDQSYHDVYASYTFDNEYSPKVYGGIRNLANDFGPLLPDGLDYGSSRNIVSSISSPIGREFYAGIKVDF